MTMTEQVSYIPNRIKNAKKGGHVAGAEDIIDDALNKDQSTINQEVKNDILNIRGGSSKNIGNLDDEINGSGGINDRLEQVEGLAEISLDGGEAQIATANDFINPTQEQKNKIPTVGAVYDSIASVRIVNTQTSVNMSIKPNKLYIFTNPIVSGTFTLEPPQDINRENEYKVQFTAGENANITFANPPIGEVSQPINWFNDDVLRAYEGTTYQVSIVNNLGIYVGWEISNNEQTNE